ncbi:hypothetical protein F2Q69_00043174 [Brassica cretica]|uniref:Uncharacterized protein n=1 Tax=Brassica cretica TaxID=69181 RepID=A0A8S9N2N2_BRACR|nr:hypothetical protein F2Q69_00043174 [Brassica cretica]
MCLRIKPSGLLFGNNQSSRLRRLQDAIRSPKLLHLRLDISGSKNSARPRSGYCPSSMTKLSNKGQTVGEKYSGIEFLQTPDRTPASGSPLGGTPSPRYKILRPGTASHPQGKGRLPIRRTFHISEYGRV